MQGGKSGVTSEGMSHSSLHLYSASPAGEVPVVSQNTYLPRLKSIFCVAKRCISYTPQFKSAAPNFTGARTPSFWQSSGCAARQARNEA